MFYSIFEHRKSMGHEAAQFHENTTVEIIWTVIPVLILVFMAFPATKTVMALKDTAAPTSPSRSPGYQWKWGYDYLKRGRRHRLRLHPLDARGADREPRPKGEHYLLEVDNPLVVPVGKKVRILTTAGDVMHAWWVPAFGVKQDAIPGFVRDTWFKAEKIGTFRGQCAELCGKEHGFMPIVVEVVSQEDYGKWVAAQKKKVAAGGRRSEQGWKHRRAHGARREGLRRQLRRVPPGDRQGLAAGVPGARRLQGRHRAEGRQIKTVLNGAADGKPTAMVAVEAALRHRDRRGDHLHAQQLGQQDRRSDAAGRGQGAAAQS